MWIRRYHSSDTSAGQLVCFPHAGGSASYYHPLSERFSPAIDMIALQYPSRQDRRQEACIRSLDILADKITEQLRLRPLEGCPLFVHHGGLQQCPGGVAPRCANGDHPLVH